MGRDGGARPGLDEAREGIAPAPEETPPVPVETAEPVAADATAPDVASAPAVDEPVVPDLSEAVEPAVEEPAPLKEEGPVASAAPAVDEPAPEPVSQDDGTALEDPVSAVEAVAQEVVPASVVVPPAPQTAEQAGPVVLAGEVVDYRAASQDDLAGTPGLKRRAWNNVEALRTLDVLGAEGRYATAAEQAVIARWSGWGALPAVFDADREDFADVRAALGGLLDDKEMAAARTSTLNAHYTDAAVTAAMWQAAVGMGLAGARVLEPGCGSGNFLVTAPDGFERSRMVGVELDPTTARVAAALSPSAHIDAEGFEKVTYPDAGFDLTIGNVPFGSFAPFDPVHNMTGESIHNAFILKSLDLTAPGGVVMVVTSRFTMDAETERARALMAERADLLGAVRLPTGAHAGAAGTDALTDVLVFRVLDEPRELTEETTPAWVQVTAAHHTADGQAWTGNRYWAQHPENILGEVGLEHGMHGENTLHVAGKDQWQEELAGRLLAVTAGVTVQVDPDAPMPAQRSRVRTGAPSLQEGYVTYDAEQNTFFQRQDGQQVPLSVGKGHVGEVRELLGLRDLVVSQLSLEAAALEETPATAANRAALNAAYDTYVAAHGPVNRYTVSTNKNGVESRRVPVAVQRLRNDPFLAQVLALEEFDDATQEARKAAVFHQMVVQARTRVEHVDRPEEALVVCQDQLGRLDIDRIAALLGVDAAAAATQVEPLTFTDPATGLLVDRGEYLSGNILDKIDVARAAAQEDSRWVGNLQALQEVAPTPLQPGEITARLGAPWIPDDVVTAFAREHFDPRARVIHAGGAEWKVDGGFVGVASLQQWGTVKVPAGVLMETLLRQKRIQVTKEDPDGKYVTDQAETEAAQAKAQDMHEAFSDWVWSDPERADRLAGIYNRTFNAVVPRVWDTSGMTFPGLVRGFVPREHQKVAVARMLGQESVGLFHEVGAGKTAEMVMGSMELKRLGMVNKPALVVPNNMLGQFQREFLQLYPQARLLVADSEQVSAAKRRTFVAQCATGDWDAVILSHSAFTAIGVMPATEAAYLDQATNAFREQVAAYDKAGVKRSVKSVETKVKKKEEKVREALDKRVEAGLTFEATGIDYLCVDELHLFKNLPIETQHEGVGSSAHVKKTVDLDMKLDFLRSRNGGRVITGATGTPVANSMSELWTMNHYLAPQLLAERGMDAFDAWAATFGVSETRLEPKPDGTYQPKERFSKFTNVPELMGLVWQFADIKTQEQLHLPRPDIAVNAEGKRAAQAVLVKPDPEVVAFQEEIKDRLERAGGGWGSSDREPVINVYGSARRGAVDVRLEHPDAYAGQLLPPATKLAAVAENVARVWEANKDNEYLVPGTQEVSDKRGALQIVFCDLGVPGGSAGLDAYEEMRTLMTQAGMDPARIRFIHEATKPREKEALFAACRAGDVDVLIGSTERMGVGTNVQTRAIALHHVDCPWKPAEITQREGRILRQGNQHEQVQIYRYVTEGSFDGFAWSTIERKAGFIAQVMSGRTTVREMEDVGANSLADDAAQLVAVATGNPLVLEAHEVRTELNQLRRAHARHDQTQSALKFTVMTKTNTVEKNALLVKELQQALARRQDTAGDKFTARANPVASAFYLKEEWAPAKDRTELATAITGRARHYQRRLSDAPVVVQHVADMGGFVWDMQLVRGAGGTTHLTLTADGVPGMEATMQLDTGPTSEGDAKPGFGVVTRMENLLGRIENRVEELQRAGDEAEKEAARARSLIGAVFPYADREHELERRTVAINAQLEPDEVRTDWQVSDEPTTPVIGTATDGTTAALHVTPGADGHPQVSLTVRAGGHTFSTADEQDWPVVVKYVPPHEWPIVIDGPVPAEERNPIEILASLCPEGVVPARVPGPVETVMPENVPIVADILPSVIESIPDPALEPAVEARGQEPVMTTSAPEGARGPARRGPVEVDWKVFDQHSAGLAEGLTPDGAGVRVFVYGQAPDAPVMVAVVREGQAYDTRTPEGQHVVMRVLGLDQLPDRPTVKDLSAFPSPDGLRRAWTQRYAPQPGQGASGQETEPVKTGDAHPEQGLSLEQRIRAVHDKVVRDQQQAAEGATSRTFPAPRNPRRDPRGDASRRDDPRQDGPRL